MGLLAPLFLIGLAAIALPVVIHLFHRQQKEPIRFPSLMFLERIPFRTVRRQTLRNPLLFALRCLLVALLAFAFSRPFLSSADIDVSETGAREVVVVLDASYSMAYADRFARALDAVRDVGAGLSVRDAVSLVTFGTDAEMPVRSATEVDLAAVLDTLQPGWTPTRLAPALEAGASVLRASTRPRRELWVVSDFQASGWEGAEDVLLPPGTQVTPLSVVEGGSPNVLVSAASARRIREGARVRVQLSARVLNQGSAPAPGTSVMLEVDDALTETVEVDLESGDGEGASAAVTFQPFVLTRPDTRITIRLAEDALTRDDQTHMVLSPEPDRSVLVVRPRGARRDQSLFLTRALSVGDGPGFLVTERREDQLTATDFARPSVVILNGAPAPSGVLLDRLLEWVQNGGGLLVALDERSSWPTDLSAALGGTFANPRNRTGARGGALGHMEFDHPVFELFRTPRSGDFTATRFFRYRPFEADSTTRVLARFDDGSVALAEQTYGEGRILVWTAGLDNFWSNFPLQPIYLPFIQSLAEHLSGRQDRPDQHLVGDLVQAAEVWNGEEDAAALMAVSPSGTEVRPQTDSTGVGFVALEQGGFYEIRPDVAGAAGRPIAVNVDRTESNLTFLEPETAVASLGSGGSVAAPGGGGDEALTVEVVERGQSYWRYLIGLALLLLLVETWTANRLSPKQKATKPSTFA